MYNDKLLYGKNSKEGIVSIENKDNKLHIYTHTGQEIINCDYYILYDKYLESYTDGRLEGVGQLRYYSKFESSKELYDFETVLKSKDIKYFKPRSPSEGMMLKAGYTQYKGMKFKDLNVLSFDLETTGALIDDNSYVLLISNTFRSSDGSTDTKLFAFDDYDSPSDFIRDWCKWVRSKNPDVLLGHNLFGFDLPYLRQFCKNQNIDGLHLGRDASKLHYARNPSKFRKDGSQSYDYINVNCYGREIIDTMFLAFKFDIGRKYESYGLKQIIKQEGLEKADRQHYDASKIRTMFTNPIEWAKIKKYAEHDADDALALFDLMAPSFFYYTQVVPMSFQNIINRATGSQVNNLMIRSYIQDGLSIPLPSDTEHFQGAEVIGNCGIYEHVYKVDVASLYPSIMLKDSIYPEDKDFNGNFLKILKTLTEERLLNKKLGKETGDRYYKDMEQAQKIVINSAYGFMGAPGLNFNYPVGAAAVTLEGRRILNIALNWAKINNFQIVNADTDSISFTNGQHIDLQKCLNELNELSGRSITWENDGQYEKVIVVKSKNYVLKHEKKTIIKGSGLKATMKEKALQKYIREVIDLLLENKSASLVEHYMSYVNQICSLTDISEWCSKKTITKAVLEGTRTNETRVMDAVEDVEGLQEGDKVYVFFETVDKLSQDKDFKGVYSRKKLFDKLFKTIKVFENIVDIKQFPNYSLKGNQKKLLEQNLIFEIE
jgi:DNA polymerase elongation subunit (family B)